MEDPDRGRSGVSGRLASRHYGDGPGVGGGTTPRARRIWQKTGSCARPRDPGRALAPGEFESATWAAIRNSHTSQGMA